MKSQVLHPAVFWCYISGEAAGEIYNWSLLKVKGWPVIACCSFAFRAAEITYAGVPVQRWALSAVASLWNTGEDVSSVKRLVLQCSLGDLLGRLSRVWGFKSSFEYTAIPCKSWVSVRTLWRVWCKNGYVHPPLGFRIWLNRLRVGLALWFG